MTTPSQSMVERVARALCDDDQARRFADQEGDDSYDCSTEYVQRYWQQLARAALTAMLDATPGMLAATVKQVGDPSPENWAMAERVVLGTLGIPHAAGEAAVAELARDWQAMISAALNEGEG